MANSGLFAALCAVLLAVDGSAQPVPAGSAPPASPCIFTLERDTAPVADDEGEIWLLTCHRSAKAASLQPVVQRRVIEAPVKAAG